MSSVHAIALEYDSWECLLCFLRSEDGHIAFLVCAVCSLAVGCGSSARQALVVEGYSLQATHTHTHPSPP